MANTVQLKKSSVPGKVPLTTDLSLGQLAMNLYDGKLFLKRVQGEAEDVILVNEPHSVTDVPDTLVKRGENGEINVRSINLTTGSSSTPIKGQLLWNEEDGTADLGLNGGEVVLQIGQELHQRVINQTGSTIDNGTLVMLAGTVGGSGKLLIEPWDGVSDPRKILGIVTESIPTEDELSEEPGLGFITYFGKVRGIQTDGTNYSETWVDGDTIYAGPNGGLTNILPTAPKTKTVIGTVIRSHATAGILKVNVHVSSSLGNDDLVHFDNLQNGHVLAYNATTGRFENTPPSGGGGLSPWAVKTSAYTAFVGDRLLADTSGGSFTITLPAAPFTGATVSLADAADWSVNPLTIARNGNTIEGYTEDLVVDIAGIQVELVYGSTGWEVFALTGPSVGIESAGGDVSFPVIMSAPGDGKLNTGYKDNDYLYYNPVSKTLHSQNFNSLSDARFKTNITTIFNGLEVIEKINPVSFDWINSGKRSNGVIAQEMEAILPEIVSEFEGRKSVNYDQLVPFLVSAVKKLSAEVRILKEAIKNDN